MTSTSAATFPYRTINTSAGVLVVVTYHGSLTAHHGEMAQVEQCYCRDCTAALDQWDTHQQDAPPTRWVLMSLPGAASPITLACVSHESFTPQTLTPGRDN